jgi:dTDP-4-dehydrorhamnose reductase
MKLLIVGGTGMLGHKLFQHLSRIYPDTYATVWEDIKETPFVNVPFLQTEKVYTGVDVTALEALTGLILDLKPDYIINCVGVIKQHKVKVALASPCIKLNSLLPHQLVEIGAKYGGRVIHFSTDCVFDGSRGSYTEEDLPNAIDLYGRSKAMGEVIYDNALTLRTSIIGRELVNHLSLLDWFLKQSGTPIRGFTKALYSGITTNQMVKVIELILKDFPTLNGLYQIVAEPISKYDLLCLAKDIFKVGIDIEPYDDFSIDRSMQGNKFKSVIGYESPPWMDMLEDLAAESDLYRSWGIEL